MHSAVETTGPAAGAFPFDDPFFVVVGVLAVAIAGLFLSLLVRNLRLMRRVGVDPLASAASRAAVGHRRGVPLAQRLQELDDLRQRGVISEAEHSLARHKVLTGG